MELNNIGLWVSIFIALYGVICFVMGMWVYKWLLKKEN